jgi:glutamate decarboxylase
VSIHWPTRHPQLNLTSLPLYLSGGEGLPLVAWRLAKKEKYDEFAIARHLRTRGWIVPAYTMAPHASELKLLRVVVREDFSRHRCDTFLRDLNAVRFHM